MRSVIILSSIIVILFAGFSCKKADVSEFTGTYTGKLTAKDFIKENVQLTFTSTSNKNTLCLFDIALTKVSDNQFHADGEIILEIIHLVEPNITTDIVSNATVTFVFENEEVTMDMRYNLSARTGSVNIRYIGKK